MNWKKIRTLDGAQWKGFEELTCQIFAVEYASCGDFRRRAAGQGDGGVEAFFRSSGGGICKAIQAKFPSSSPPWSSLDKSVERALDTIGDQKSLNEYVVACPFDLSSQQEATWKMHVAEWRSLAKTKGFGSIAFTWWGAAELGTYLTEERHRGRHLYWLGALDFDHGRSGDLLEAAVTQWGTRYLPNLHVPTPIDGKLDSFLQTNTYYKRFRELALEALKAKIKLERSLGDTNTKNSLKTSFEHWASTTWAPIAPLLGDGIAAPVQPGTIGRKFCEARETLRKIFDPTPKSATGEDLLESSAHEWRKFSRVLEELIKYLEKSTCGDATCLQVIGKAGAGKSHFLAHFAKVTHERGGLVVPMLGDQFSDQDPRQQLLKHADVSCSFRELLELLNAGGETARVPSLILIDGLNETPATGFWKARIASLGSEVSKYQHVRLLVSCRNDYVDQCIPSGLSGANDWNIVNHKGLGVHVKDAMRQYFEHYQVSLSGTPAYLGEFQNPLFLRIFCETYKGREFPGTSQSFADLLRTYVGARCKAIEDTFGCPVDATQRCLSNLAEAFANQAITLPEAEVREITLKEFSTQEEKSSLYHALVEEEILDRFPLETDLGVAYKTRFVFHRLLDYLTVKTLVGSLDGPPSNQSDFWVRMENFSDSLATLSIAQVCDRWPNWCPQTTLLDSTQNYRMRALWIRSLELRTPQSITAESVSILEGFYPIADGWEQRFSLIARCLFIEGHPLNADYLHATLVELPLYDRDLYWSRWVNSTFDQIGNDFEPIGHLELIEGLPLRELSEEQVRLLSLGFTWLLTSTVRELRDRVTLAVIRLLKVCPRVVLEYYEAFRLVDDPYVRERVLAAIHGVALDCGDAKIVTETGELVLQDVFLSGDPDPHINIRHHARAIADLVKISGDAHLPPYQSVWPEIWDVKDCNEYEAKNVDSKYHCAIFRSCRTTANGSYGDWGRCDLEDAVEHFSPLRLGDESSLERGARFDADTARRYVLESIKNSDWSPHSENSYYSFDGSRQRPEIERISKKYQWIAMAKLLGLLSDHFQLRGDLGDLSTLTYSHPRQIGCSDWDPVRANFLEVLPRLPTLAPESLTQTITDLHQPEKWVEHGDWLDPAYMIQPKLSQNPNSGWLCLDLSTDHHVELTFQDQIRGVDKITSQWLMDSYLLSVEDVLKFSSFLSRSERRFLNNTAQSCSPEYQDDEIELFKDFTIANRSDREICHDTFSSCQYAVASLSVGETGENWTTAKIPSRALCELAGIGWAKQGVQFCRRDGLRDLVAYDPGFRNDSKSTLLINRAYLAEKLIEEKKVIFFQFYGWRTVVSGGVGRTGMAEQLVNYAFDGKSVKKVGKPKDVWWPA